jgi:uncharacterized repeat protein (TIGR03803 family)
MQQATLVRRLQGLTGMLFVGLFCAAAAIASPAQAPDTLVNFTGANGANPANMSMIQGTDGNLWGTTLYGGATYGVGNEGYGEVFKMTPSGVSTIVYSFCSLANCTDGSYPYDSLVQGSDGNFYGTTSGGGAYSNGTVFKLTPQGKLTTLHNFCEVQGCPDGTNVYAGLIQASNGDFYGVTAGGGMDCGSCDGTFFKITAKGVLTTLYTFHGGSEGSSPAGLIQGSSGLFYGTTTFGGQGEIGGSGTVFKMTAAGDLTTLYEFCAQSGCPDGSNPEASVVQGSDGNFYGTTSAGGTNNLGTVFKITPKGKLTTLYSFSLDVGYHPNSPLIQATDGNFYGTTYDGDGDQCGTGCVFQITSSGVFTNVVDFATEAEGRYPLGGVNQDTNGNFYGSTYQGGAGGDGADSGTLFEWTTGFGPFVATAPTFGKEEAKIGILGQGFSSSSVVKFGGTKATTIVLSGTTFITATVPAGAMTGAVTVTTGSTTLTSPQTFKVTPTITAFAPPSGPVGTSVTITGTGLKQATKVAFDGKSATFTVISDTEVTADVPADAVTGKITVTTKGGSAVSATSFTVD